MTKYMSVEEFANSVVAKIAYSIEQTAKRIHTTNGSVNTGYLRNKIKTKKTNHGYEVRAEAPYSAAVEFGARAHPMNPYWLKRWAKLKLGDEKAMFAVAKNIAKKGAKAKPYMRPAVQEVVNKNSF